VAKPEAVPAEVGDVRGLELILVEQESQMRIWNELMIGEHPVVSGNWNAWYIMRPAHNN
jgi:hypothetical protein